MEEIKNEETKALNKEELENASGGVDEKATLLSSLEEVENSPIFEKLKSWLRKYKDAGHHKNAEATLVNVQRCVISLGYFITFQAGHAFIRKYWDLV
ncbi:MAG: hypothetical protein J6S49_09350 [Erysipelotrichaceae bacterium]|nr:hypothetical protein [Erysipelotrichaceae bacterium]